MAENERVPSNHELYLDSLAKAREEEGNTAEANAEAVTAAPYAVEGNETDAFVGVSPEYKTYSGEFGKPYLTEEGPTADAEKEGQERVVLQAAASPVHPSEAKATPVAAAREAEAEKAEEKDETPVVPPVTPPAPKASAKAADKPADSNKN